MENLENKTLKEKAKKPVLYAAIVLALAASVATFNKGTQFDQIGRNLRKNPKIVQMSELRNYFTSKRSAKIRLVDVYDSEAIEKAKLCQKLANDSEYLDIKEKIDSAELKAFGLGAGSTILGFGGLATLAYYKWFSSKIKKRN